MFLDNSTQSIVKFSGNISLIYVYLSKQFKVKFSRCYETKFKEIKFSSITYF